MAMTRNTEVLKFTMGTAVANSTTIPFGNYAGGQVYVPAGSAITALAWYGSPNGETWTPVYDGAGSPATSIIAAGQNCLIPAACFASSSLRGVASGGAGTVFISLKS